MLEYSKTILKKVSFDRSLFERELIKAIDNILGEKLNEFINWCYSNFEDTHYDILTRCFNHYE